MSGIHLKKHHMANNQMHTKKHLKASHLVDIKKHLKEFQLAIIKKHLKELRLVDTNISIMTKIVMMLNTKVKKISVIPIHTI